MTEQQSGSGIDLKKLLNRNVLLRVAGASATLMLALGAFAGFGMAGTKAREIMSAQNGNETGIEWCDCEEGRKQFARRIQAITTQDTTEATIEKAKAALRECAMTCVGN